MKAPIRSAWAVGLLAVVTLSACSSENTGPTLVDASPSPSPSGLPVSPTSSPPPTTSPSPSPTGGPPPTMDPSPTASPSPSPSVSPSPAPTGPVVIQGRLHQIDVGPFDELQVSGGIEVVDTPLFVASFEDDAFIDNLSDQVFEGEGFVYAVAGRDGPELLANENRLTRVELGIDRVLGTADPGVAALLAGQGIDSLPGAARFFAGTRSDTRFMLGQTVINSASVLLLNDAALSAITAIRPK